MRLRPYLRDKARRLSGDDPSIADDLIQLALIRLWELDPSRYDEHDEMHLKRSLVACIRRAIRREPGNSQPGPRRSK